MAGAHAPDTAAGQHDRGSSLRPAGACAPARLYGGPAGRGFSLRPGRPDCRELPPGRGTCSGHLRERMAHGPPSPEGLRVTQGAVDRRAHITRGSMYSRSPRGVGSRHRTTITQGPGLTPGSGRPRRVDFTQGSVSTRMSCSVVWAALAPWVHAGVRARSPPTPIQGHLRGVGGLAGPPSPEGPAGHPRERTTTRGRRQLGA